MCQNGTNCKRGVCFFAHTVSDLRVPDYSHLNIPPELIAADKAEKAAKAGGGSMAGPGGVSPAAAGSGSSMNGFRSNGSSSYLAHMGSGTSSRNSMDRTSSEVPRGSFDMMRGSFDVPRSPAAPMTPAMAMSPGLLAGGSGLPPTYGGPHGMDAALAQLAAARAAAASYNAMLMAHGQVPVASAASDQRLSLDVSSEMSADSILSPGMLAQQRAALLQQHQARRSCSSDFLGGWRTSGEFSPPGSPGGGNGNGGNGNGGSTRRSSSISAPLPQLHPAALNAAVAAAAAQLQGGLAIGTPSQSPSQHSLQAMLSRSTSGNASALLNAAAAAAAAAAAGGAMPSPAGNMPHATAGMPAGLFNAGNTSSYGELPPIRPTAAVRAASLEAAMLLQHCKDGYGAGGSSSGMPSPAAAAAGMAFGYPTSSPASSGGNGTFDPLALEAAAAAAAAPGGASDPQGLAQLTQLIDVVNRNPGLTSNQLLMGLINKALAGVGGGMQQQDNQGGGAYTGYLS